MKNRRDKLMNDQKLSTKLAELVLKLRQNGYWDDALLELEPHNREFVDTSSWAGELHWEAMQKLHVAEILQLIKQDREAHAPKVMPKHRRRALTPHERAFEAEVA